MHFDCRKQKAYTLTELAVVLGIIGLIVGAIWVACASVINTMNTNELIREIRYILTTLNNIYTGDRNALTLTNPNSVGCNQSYMSSCTYNVQPSASPCTPQPVTGSWADADQTLVAVQLGVFPTNMIRPGSVYPMSPWSQVSLSTQTNTNACSNNAYGASANPPTSASYTVILNFSSMPSIACTRLLMSAGHELASRGLIQLGIGTVTQAYMYGASNISTSNVSSILSSSNVSTWCTIAGTASNVQLSLQFNWPPTTF